MDYTNYLILGITVALAWELPSKPPSEIIEELHDKLNDGSLGLHRNDTFNKIKYIETPKPSFNQKLNLPSFYSPSQTDSYYARPPIYSYKNWQNTNQWKNSNDIKTRPQMNYSDYYQNKYDNKYNYTYEYKTKFNRRKDNKPSNYYMNSWTENDAHWKTYNGGKWPNR